VVTDLLISAEKSLKATLTVDATLRDTYSEGQMHLTPACLSVLTRGDVDLFSSVVFFSRLQRICWTWAVTKFPLVTLLESALQVRIAFKLLVLSK